MGEQILSEGKEMYSIFKSGSLIRQYDEVES